MRTNQRWRMDFVEQQSVDGRLVRVLMIVDQSTRERLAEIADDSPSGEKLTAALDKVVAQRGTPDSIMVDNATGLRSKTLAFWACRNGVYLRFARPGRPWWKGGSYADRHRVP
jgi:putative transposase